MDATLAQATTDIGAWINHHATGQLPRLYRLSVSARQVGFAADVEISPAQPLLPAIADWAEYLDGEVELDPHIDVLGIEIVSPDLPHGLCVQADLDGDERQVLLAHLSRDERLDEVVSIATVRAAAHALQQRTDAEHHTSGQ